MCVCGCMCVREGRGACDMAWVWCGVVLCVYDVDPDRIVMVSEGGEREGGVKV